VAEYYRFSFSYDQWSSPDTPEVVVPHDITSRLHFARAGWIAREAYLVPLGSQLAAHAPFPAAGSGASSYPSLHSAVRSSVLVATDCITFLLAIALVQAWFSGNGKGTLLQPLTLHELGLALFLPSISLLAYFHVRGRYSQRLPFWSETGCVVAAGLFQLTIQTLAAILSSVTAHRVPEVLALGLFTICAPLGNRLVKHILSSIGVWTLPSLVVSRSNMATSPELSQIALDPLDYRIVGHVDPSSLLSDPYGPQLRPLLARHHCEHLIIIVEDDVLVTCALADAALRERIPFSLVVPLGFSCRVAQPFGNSTIHLSRCEPPLQRVGRLFKVGLDVVAAALLITVAAPCLLAIAILIRLDGGPALFAHRRLGAHGRYFHCLKFRTMVVDADEALERILATDPKRAQEWNATQKLQDDPRITRMGYFLRKTSLDELPQLINVLRLEMSLVGPRPIVENEARFYGQQIDHYYAVRPGVTGLWQVSGRSDTSYDRRVRLDTWYVTNWSIWHDFVILLKTIPAVLKQGGAR